MIISHKKKFIFIHIPKTAGSSVTNILNPYGRFVDRIVYKYWITQKILFKSFSFFKLGNAIEKLTGFHKHAYSSTVKDRISDSIFESYYKFAFVRNPYDWLTSLYFYIKEHPEHYLHQKVNNLDFEKFIMYQIHENNLVTQSRYVCNSDGKLLVNYTAKFEMLQEECNYLSKTLNIKREQIPVINKTKIRNKQYKDLFTPAIYKEVNNHFHMDFVLFGYEKEKV